MPLSVDPAALVAEILELPDGSVALDADLEALDWDSLASLSFIAIADERYHVVVDARRLADCTTPADLGALLSAAAA